MRTTLPAALGLLETRRLDAAAAALATHAGPSRTGVIARFRRAEALSRLGQHDEAVEEARRAVADDGANGSAAPLWLAWTLAEAGRYDEAAAVALPETSVESLDFLREGFAALARLASGATPWTDADARAIVGTHHVPLLSLALRVAESQRLARTPRWPDLPSVWYAIECRLECEHDRLREHPATPAAPRGGEAARQAARWVRMHCSCGDHTALVAAIRACGAVPADIEEAELEMLLSLGRVDAADALATRLAEEAGKDAAGELAVCRARIAQLRGEAVRVDAFEGADDARKRLSQMCAWLDVGAALLAGDPVAARAAADAVADPARAEFVEAALAPRGTSAQE